MYNKYEKVLLQESGVDFSYYNKVIRDNGNETGIYPDVALLLCRMVASPLVGSVLEFGSGMSTLVMSKVSSLYNKRYIAAEHDTKWYGITNKCMSDLKLDTKHLVCTESEESRFPEVMGEVDVVWVDGNLSCVVGPGYGRDGSCYYYKDKLLNSCLLFDDAQWEGIRAPCKDFLFSIGCTEESISFFNPTGREDRHVMVSVPNANYTEIVESCLL